MLDELSQFRESINILVQFVAGEIDGPELQAALETSEMQELLGHFEEPRYPASTNHNRRLY